jgi:hypothetical protein
VSKIFVRRVRSRIRCVDRKATVLWRESRLRLGVLAQGAGYDAAWCANDLVFAANCG